MVDSVRDAFADTETTEILWTYTTDIAVDRRDSSIKREPVLVYPSDIFVIRPESVTLAIERPLSEIADPV